MKILSARKITLCLVALMATFLFPPKLSLAASSASFSSYPSAVMVGEEFTVSFFIDSLEATSSYYLKSRIGPDISHLTKGQTKSDSKEWLSDSESWGSGKFPLFTTDENGDVTGIISSRVSSTVGVIGENYYTLRILKVGEDSSRAQTPDGSFAFLVNPAPTTTPTSTPSLGPTPISTPIPTLLSASPTPTAKAVYQINAAKDEDGEELGHVEIWVDGIYIHCYPPETLTFCDSCQCNGYAACGLGQHTVTLSKSGYEDWSETKNYSAGQSITVDPVLEKSTSDSTQVTPTPSPSTSRAAPTSTPTKKLTPSLSVSPSVSSGEVLGEEEATTSFYPWEATGEAKTATESSDRSPRWATILFILGLVLLFGSALYLWYIYAKHDSGHGGKA